MGEKAQLLTFGSWKRKFLDLLHKPSFLAAQIACTAAGYWIPMVYPAVGMDDTAATLDYYLNQGGS